MRHTTELNDNCHILTTKASITTKFVCFKCLEASLANSVDPDQTAPIGTVRSGPCCLFLYFNSSVKLGNYLIWSLLFVSILEFISEVRQFFDLVHAVCFYTLIHQ